MKILARAFLYFCGLLLGLSGCYLATSCVAHRPTPATPPLAQHADLPPPGGRTPADSLPKHLARADSLSTLVEKSVHALGQKAPFLGIFGKKKPASVAESPFLGGAQSPRKCKNCTIVYSAGPATVTNAAKKSQVLGDGATSIEKAKAPVATGPGDATDNTKAGQRGGAAATAPNATATATTEKSGLPWWFWVIVVGGGGYTIYRKFFT